MSTVCKIKVFVIKRYKEARTSYGGLSSIFADQTTLKDYEYQKNWFNVLRLIKNLLFIIGTNNIIHNC